MNAVKSKKSRQKHKQDKPAFTIIKVAGQPKKTESVRLYRENNQQVLARFGTEQDYGDEAESRSLIS